MPHFLDNVTNQYDRGVANPTVTVYDYNTLSLSTIFQDELLSQTKQNPFQGDAEGMIDFWAPSGDYTLSISGGVPPITPTTFAVSLGGSGGGSSSGSILVIRSQQATITCDGTDKVISSYTIPANSVSASSAIELDTSWAHTGAGSVTYKLNWGANSITIVSSTLAALGLTIIATLGTQGNPTRQNIMITTAAGSVVELAGTSDPTGPIAVTITANGAGTESITTQQFIAKQLALDGSGGGSGGGSGLFTQSQQVSTGSIAAGAVTGVAITWPTAFTGTAYNIAHNIVQTGADATNIFLRIIGVVSVTTTGIVVVVANDDPSSAHTGTVYAYAG